MLSWSWLYLIPPRPWSDFCIYVEGICAAGGLDRDSAHIFVGVVSDMVHCCDARACVAGSALRLSAHHKLEIDIPISEIFEVYVASVDSFIMALLVVVPHRKRLAADIVTIAVLCFTNRGDRHALTTACASKAYCLFACRLSLAHGQEQR